MNNNPLNPKAKSGIDIKTSFIKSALALNYKVILYKLLNLRSFAKKAVKLLEKFLIISKTIGVQNIFKIKNKIRKD